MLCRRSLLLGSLAALAGGLTPRQLPAAASEAEETLREAGLRRHGDNLWLLPREPGLRELVEGLPAIRDSITVLERDVAAQIEENRKAFEASQQAVAALKQAIDKLSPGDPKRKMLEQQLAAERQRTVPPDEVGGKDEVRSIVVQLSQQRTTLILRLLQARRELPDLIKRYAELAKKRSIVDALQEGGQRLGPLKPLQPELRRLGELDSAAFTASMPVWLQSGKPRFTAVVNERQPLTLTWNDYPGRGAVLTNGAAQSLDVRPPSGAEQKTIEFDKRRKVKVTAARLTSFRVGRWVIAEMPIWVLPPEGEDLGSQIDATALGSYTARCEPARLRLTLQTRE